MRPSSRRGVGVEGEEDEEEEDIEVESNGRSSTSEANADAVDCNRISNGRSCRQQGLLRRDNGRNGPFHIAVLIHLVCIEFIEESASSALDDQMS